MASNTIKAQVAASPRDLNPSGFDMTAGRVGFVLGSSVTVTPSLTAIINVSAGSVTVTLPSAASYPNRQLFFLTRDATSPIVSASSNVVPRTGATGTSICGNTAGSWAHLISDGSTWSMIGGA